MDYSNVKVCPECGAEFYSHVESCSDCGVPLGWKENRDWDRAKGEAPASGSLTAPFLLWRGSLSTAKEFANMLTAQGIAVAILPGDECQTSKCSPSFALAVEKDHAEEAKRILESPYTEFHDHLNQAEAWAEESCCPACGTRTGEGMKECPDCGLVLGYEEED